MCSAGNRLITFPLLPFNNGISVKQERSQKFYPCSPSNQPVCKQSPDCPIHCEPKPRAAMVQSSLSVGVSSDPRAPAAGGRVGGVAADLHVVPPAGAARRHATGPHPRLRLPRGLRFGVGAVREVSDRVGIWVEAKRWNGNRNRNDMKSGRVLKLSSGSEEWAGLNRVLWSPPKH